MNILVVYFSFTSTVQTLAEAIRAELERTTKVTTVTIDPQMRHGYWGWLARSFLPGWRAPIKQTITDLTPYDLVCLGFPKWTLSCPPVNQYLQEMRGSRGKNIALFMAYRGFDEKRYLQSMVRKLSKRGVDVVATLCVRRSAIRQGAFEEELRSFCRQVRSALEEHSKSHRAAL